MNTLIVTGGYINENFFKEHLLKNKYDTIIAADKGLEALKNINIEPQYIIGDFDSINKNVLKQYENKKISITYLKPEKDFTDTHMALKQAINIGSKKITIIGGSGTRLDHTIGNVHVLKEALDKNIETSIINENNIITLINKDKKIKKNEEFKYISLIPLTTSASGVTLDGFKYLLENATLNIGESLGISNEQTKDLACVKIKEGILILIFSKD